MNKTNIVQDAKSGLFISLIALPLCLGIAIASSFPPIAGVITAIIGGIVVSLVGGCSFAIKGPAAGLIVIVLASVIDLGAGDPYLGYKRTLAVGVIAAILQIIFALLKAGRLGKLMPPSIIHGMLAAIGVIIISKQLHILVGAKPHGKTTLQLIAEIPQSILNINPELAFIGLITLVLMVTIPMIDNHILKRIPPALMSLSVVVPLGLIWHLSNSHTYSFLSHEFYVGPEFLVNIPSNVLSSIVFPDFSILKNAIAYKYVLMLSLVGSVESVLTVIAIDSLSKNKKKSDLDRDLLGIGIGNLICSLIGGLPMISEVVRSKANIDSGATGRWSNFFHGLFLLLAICWMAPILKQIPLAALAAMLIITGIRLASPKQFTHTYRIGVDQFVLFISTLLVTLATDLLIGVGAGIAIKVLMHLARGVKIAQLFRTFASEEQAVSNNAHIIIRGPAIFTNYLSLQKQTLSLAQTNKHIEIDFSKATLVDHTTLSCLQSLKDELGGDSLSISGLDKLNRVSNHQLSTHRFA